MIRFEAASETGNVNIEQASELLTEMIEGMPTMSRVLIVPPDITRYHSWAGELTVLLYQLLKKKAHVEFLPALGTHTPMTAAQLDRMYPGIPHHLFIVHDWRKNLEHMGTLEGDFVSEVSDGKVDYEIKCELDGVLVNGKWSRIFSVGQLVPHEVIGIANHVKNILIGTGGKEIIDKSHFLGAVCNMESIMGRIDSPVRSVLQKMSDRFLSEIPITYLLTVRARDESGQMVTRGLYAGDDRECYVKGAKLSQKVNIILLKKPIKRAIVQLDPDEFKSTWLGNKAIYRTRMAMADDAELIILGDGVREFGEDKKIDSLIRQFGYRDTESTLESVRKNPELAGNLSAAAHLIHGSSEGRFRIKWCAGGLTKEEVQGAGYEYADPVQMRKHYKVDPLQEGLQAGPDGEELFYISNPALGLWALESDFEAAQS